MFCPGTRAKRAYTGGKKGSTMTPNKGSQGLQKGTSHSHSIQWSGVVVVVTSLHMLTPVSSRLHVMYIITSTRTHTHTQLSDGKNLKGPVFLSPPLHNSSTRRHVVSALTLPAKGGRREEGRALPLFLSDYCIKPASHQSLNSSFALRWALSISYFI